MLAFPGVLPVLLTSRQPNIIFALGDDTGWHGVGWHNDLACKADPVCAMQTPRMDALIEVGVELNNHYTYRFCSPTRASLMTGRLPIHVNQQNSAEWPWTAAAMHPGFVTIADVLSRAGYSTHQIGKWHLGLATPRFTPAGRGFNTSLGFLSGSEEHFSHKKGAVRCQASRPLNCSAKCAVDLWSTNAPATKYDGEYSAYIYTEETLRIIEAGSSPDADPFYVYLAYANTHEPLEAPQKYLDLYPATMVPPSRRMLGAMVSAMDEGIGNITDALKLAGLWSSTLLVWIADNGGPDGAGTSGAKAAQCAANNYPLRGGKGSGYQGGVRTAGFVSGGLLPAEVRGTKANGYIHVADWFATLTSVAGLRGAAAADDDVAVSLGLPKSDSLDAWPMIVGRSPSFRTEIPISITANAGSTENITLENMEGALIVGDLKLIRGFIGVGLHWNPYPPSLTLSRSLDTHEKLKLTQNTNVGFCTRYYPNSTVRPPANDPGCPIGPSGKQGCLYNITSDPEERHDLAKQTEFQTVFATLTARMSELAKGVFQSDHQSDNKGAYDCEACLEASLGMWKQATGRQWFGPWR